MTVEIVLAIAGSVALLIGIFGGGVEAKEVKFPVIQNSTRIWSSLTGVILIIGSILLNKPDLLAATPTPNIERPEFSAAPITEAPTAEESVTVLLVDEYDTQAQAQILSLENNSLVEAVIEISGSASKTQKGERLFLCIKTHIDNSSTNCQAEIKPNMVGLWSANASYSSRNQEYDTFIVVTQNDNSAGQLLQSYTNGIALEQLAEIKIISPIITVTRK